MWFAATVSIDSSGSLFNKESALLYIANESNVTRMLEVLYMYIMIMKYMVMKEN